jgi:streptogramin lyase
MSSTRNLASLAAAFWLAVPGMAAADVLLSGVVKSPGGEPLGGVTVSAKAQGQTITTSVFTDQQGRYDFPGLEPGTYKVWAQAVTYRTAKRDLDLAKSDSQDFTLEKLDDFVRQLTGDQLIAALPDETPEDRRMKRLVHNNCSGCHTPSYVFQHRFDEDGWSKIIDLMKRVNVSGIYQGPEAKPNAILDFYQKDLAAYLARARGPGETSMKFKPRPRPAGETARVVIKEYDVPVQPELGLDKTLINDGSDWLAGTPSRSGSIVHDAWLDFDGNLWFTSNTPNPRNTIGRIDAKSGAVKSLKIEGQEGRAAQTHGMVRDSAGMIWFNVNTGKGGLARLDPKTEKMDVYMPPEGMSQTGGATTVDIDGKGKIWVSSPDGVLRFDPDTQKFSEFKSVTFKTPHGNGITYGVAADRDGNGWWAQMGLDIVGKSDIASGRSLEIKLPPMNLVDVERVASDERRMFDAYSQLDFNNPYPWMQGPRRMGADKTGEYVWVCNFWGGSFAKINTRTLELTIVPLPNQDSQYPYHAQIDSKHNVWVNMMNAEQVLRFNPQNNEATYFDLPTLGAETRFLSLDERGGAMKVVLPYSRTSKVAVMTFRSEADIEALRKQPR